MDAPYRESTSARPIRVVLREFRWPGSPRVLWAIVPFLVIVVWEIGSIFSSGKAGLRGDSWFSTIMIFVLMAISIAYIVHRAYDGQNDAVRLFEDAIVVAREGSVSEIRWDDVATITSEAWRDERGQLAQRHVLTSAQGRVMTFTQQLSEVEALAAELEERVVQRVLPGALMTFRGGAPVRFGEVSVDRRGVVWAGRAAVPWSAIESAAVAHGTLTLRHAEGTARFERVPNAMVLAKLIEHARRPLVDAGA